MLQSVTVVPGSSLKPAEAALFVGVVDASPASSPSRAQRRPARARLDDATADLDHAGTLGAALERTEFSADAGKITEAPGGAARFPRAFVVGLGRPDALDMETMRLIGAAIARKCAEIKAPAAAVEIHHALGSESALEPARAGKAVGEAFGLLACDFDEFRGKATAAAPRPSVRLASSDADFVAGLRLGLALAESANISRVISNTPPNVATPAWIAERAKAIGRKAGLKVDVMAGPALERAKMTGLINVGKASENLPCMIRLEYTPKGGGKGQRPIVLIGKTMTYDTGGLSLKVNNGMRGMKGDKDGGCAVLGAMHAIATVVKPRRRVVALLAAAENSVSDEAYRPDDVLTYRNGVTVEVTNTDAEGRLVLADALCWACKEEKAQSIIDLATLTGGVIVALGSTYAGMFCEDDALRAHVEAAASASGERVWRLPMHREYREMMKSTIADILNSNPDRKAHPIQGAAFLSYFVEEGVPWCHLDIAGVHRSEGDKGMYVRDVPTGWGVRLLAELIAGM